MVEPSVRVAFVHDWLTSYAGSERVLEQMLHVFPEADVYSLVDFLPEEERRCVMGKPVHTSFVQRLPFAGRLYRHYLPLMPLAVEQFDLSGYDLVVSSSHAVAKGVITAPDQLHICYCHSPIRYAWDLQGRYLSETGLDRGARGLVTRAVLHYIRLWDVRTAHGVDAFIANSEFVSGRIRKCYGRSATVMHPPVNVSAFALGKRKDDFYLAASRLVPYKGIRLIVEAFARMPDRRLVVVGDGPEAKRIRAVATPNVELVGYQPLPDLKRYMQRARALIFAAVEDFGIIPVEAQACGTPVLAYGRGGARETVLAERTGLFFGEQAPESIVDVIRRFEARADTFDPVAIRRHAEQFDVPRFREEFASFVVTQWRERFGSEPPAGWSGRTPGTGDVVASGSEGVVGGASPAS